MKNPNSRALGLVALFLALTLITPLSRAQPTTYPFTGTITAAGTENWFGANVIYNHVLLQAQSNNTNNCGVQDAHQQVVGAGMDSSASFSYALGATRGVCGTARVSVAGAFSDQVNNNDVQLSKTNSGSFAVSAGGSYTLSAIAEGGGTYATLDVFVPDHVEYGPGSARQTNALSASGSVSVYAGETNLGHFYVSLQPQHGGSFSDVTYTVSSSSSNVVLVFADTGTRTTSNPSTTIIARIAVPNITPASVTRSNGSIIFRWATIAGRSYQIQSRASLGTGSWINLGNPIVASGVSLQYTEPTTNAPQRFYRIQAL